MRLDVEQERKWFHAYQYLYAFPSMSLLYFSVQMADMQNLYEGCCYKVRFLGTSLSQTQLAWILKGVHFGWLFALPVYLHGFAALYFSCVATLVGSFWTALLFIVSHNLESCKPGYAMSQRALKDWAVWQIETSASWGGRVACFLTGGLNLQIEHHLFPCLPHDTHPAIATIVREECLKAGIRYNSYDHLSDIVWSLIAFLKTMGTDDAPPVNANEATKSPVHKAVGAIATGAGAVADAAGSVASVAAGIAQSAKDANDQMAKEDKADSFNSDDPYAAHRMVKPILLVAIYQGLQEWYTSYWPQDITIWRETSWHKPAAFNVLYFCMIYFGTKFMENREPNPRLRKYMLTYNLYQVVLNAWCVVGLIWEACKHDNPFHFRVEDSSYKLTFLIWVHYNNKFIELFDTTFMVFNKKKKQVSFLHVYHHVLIMWSWWAVCVWGCGGLAWFSAMMNSLIHVVMYGYYTLAALKLPCPWKKNITQMQLGQFVLCMSSAVYAMAQGIYPFYLSCLNIWVMLNMLVLFWQFFKQAYNKPAKNATDAASVTTEKATPVAVAAGGDKKTN